MKKIFGLMLVLVMTAAIFAGCAKEEPVVEETPEVTEEATEEVAEETAEEATEEEVDAVSTASIVTEGDALVAALGADGFWLAATLNDIVLEEDLVVEGEFIHREEIARKLGLYTQDADRNVLERFTLTAPSLIVKSENFRLQGGTFVGDVYVEANGFHLVDNTIEGNLYFASQEYMDSRVEDETGVVTGAVEVK
ncbi:conserved exported protein of unknown function [Petrocella atlantisensis]|uniref:Polymer-forming cytoskeletal protein n=1 Tax=Petrocella atlantisensis TaxID=2173034 RepID=A0A3P7S0E0_9FIRM|nr:hypothetical protein [Petrocella atlantisensis]VDN48202.1 conserved exported protein of unknown function [Petrocella atlantisensis]